MVNFSKPIILLLKLVTIIIIAASTYIFLLKVCYRFDKGNYNAAILDKLQLLKSTTSPKIVFVGGSNLAFGLDSSTIKQAFGLPVVNMGLQAGLGLKYMLDQVKPYLKRGDVVVVVPEYHHFTGNIFYGEDVLIDIAEITHDWSILVNMPISSLVDSVLVRNRRIFNYSLNYPSQPTSTVYMRNSFNSYGDVIAHLKLPNKKLSSDSKPIDTNINQAAVRYLANFIATNSEHGVTTLVLYPCIARSYYIRRSSLIAILSKAISNSGIIISSSPQNFIYDDNMFFDTHYHLNAHGRKLRTEEIIHKMSSAMNNTAHFVNN